jgi:dihydrofolate reductase
VRELVFSINLTLDGFIDHTAVVVDDELHRRAAALVRGAGVVFYGRVAWQLMADYWPAAPRNAALPKSVRDFAETINRAEKVVFSRTLKEAGWNTKILRGVDPEEIRGMKRRPGKYLLLGPGAEIARTFMQLDLIDEYRFWIQPVLLGKGIRLFPDSDRRRDLILTGWNRFRSGAMELIYRPAAAG